MLYTVIYTYTPSPPHPHTHTHSTSTPTHTHACLNTSHTYSALKDIRKLFSREIKDTIRVNDVTSPLYLITYVYKPRHTANRIVVLIATPTFIYISDVMLCYVAHLPRVIRAGVAVPPTVYRAQVKHVLLGIKTLLFSIVVLHKCSL